MNAHHTCGTCARAQTGRGLLLAVLLLVPCVALAASEKDKKLIADVERGDVAAVQQDLVNGADVNAKDDDGWTALIWAAYLVHADVARVLLDHGADMNAKDKHGRTALMEAAEHAHNEVALDHGTDVAKVLLDRGADVNAKDNDGITALMSAAYWGHRNLAKVLLDHGADVNAKNRWGWTALWYAVGGGYGYADVAKVLLEYGADVNVQDNDGMTDLMWAAKSGHADVARVLLDHGADVNAKDKLGKTALDHAIGEQTRNLVSSYLLLGQSGRKEVATGNVAAGAGRPRESLQHYVAALQSLPEETPIMAEQPLLEKIIKAVLHLNPPPAKPEEAIRHFGYAQGAFEEAKQSSDYNNAVSELEKALRLAPWWDKAYFNLGLLLEKTNRPGEAVQALQLYLLANPRAQNVEDIQTRIYKLRNKAKKQ